MVAGRHRPAWLWVRAFLLICRQRQQRGSANRAANSDVSPRNAVLDIDDAVMHPHETLCLTPSNFKLPGTRGSAFGRLDSNSPLVQAARRVALRRVGSGESGSPGEGWVAVAHILICMPWKPWAPSWACSSAVRPSSPATHNTGVTSLFTEGLAIAAQGQCRAFSRSGPTQVEHNTKPARYTNVKQINIIQKLVPSVLL